MACHSVIPSAGRAAFIGFVAVLPWVPATGSAQSRSSVHPTPPPAVRAVPASTPVVLDGRLDEAVWREAAPATDFRQSQPEEGAPATQRTEVRFVYDEAALYVGARMYDDLGAAGVRTRLTRRDGAVDSDELILVFDTYHDHLGRAEFRINPSGVKGDALGPGGASPDPSWDPVWEAATRIDSAGWVAELRIPFSQLRFSRDSVQTWGMQVVRMVSRLNERSHWAFWRLNETGGPSRYGHLAGLHVSPSSRGMEILPYVVARSAFIEPVEAGDPLHDAEETDFRIGADIKYLLTSNLTLSATVNPDFGQVEVDPAVVNLSAFETFFPERRPFFVEGAGMFGFGGLWCFFCSNASSLNVFYSRRIGRSPQGGQFAEAAGAYADVPANTTILGAAKVTGRTSNGYTVAVLDAVTRRERALVVDGDGGRFERPVEPLTNYFVGRVKRDLRGGDLVVGGVLTSVYRDLEDPALATRLSEHAEIGGVDAELWWGGKTYHLLTSAAVSQVSGAPEAIQRLQESSARYFQRPDRDGGANGLFSDAYDPSATVLRGYGAYARIAKESGDWLWEASTSLRSPGFETNDAAFLTSADYIWMSANVLRQFTEPTRYYRTLTLIAGGQQQFNYDGDVTDRQLQVYAGGQLSNYWTASAFYIHYPSVLDDRLARGGPVLRQPRGGFTQFQLSTDSRRSLVLGTNPFYSWRADGERDYAVNLGITYRPATNVSVTLAPSFGHAESTAQYIGAWEDPTATAFYGRRYIFADVLQQTVSMDTRLSVTLTPTLSIDLFAQPLISSARFSNFKEFDAPRRAERSIFGRDHGTIRAEGAGAERRYTIDPDGVGPAESITFDDPDFNFRSLRGNAVLRWEYLPGSTLYLVWTQQRDDTAPFGDMRLGRDREALFGAHPDNIFLVKVSYWLGL
ncbi:MAG TPA: DUF5916 domain-containing protein [Longimicrobiales bacterium]